MQCDLKNIKIIKRLNQELKEVRDSENMKDAE